MEKIVVLLALLVDLLFKDWVIVVNSHISPILPPSEGQACVILSSLGNYWMQVSESPTKYFWAINSFNAGISNSVLHHSLVINFL